MFNLETSYLLGSQKKKLEKFLQSKIIFFKFDAQLDYRNTNSSEYNDAGYIIFFKKNWS